MTAVAKRMRCLQTSPGGVEEGSAVANAANSGGSGGAGSACGTDSAIFLTGSGSGGGGGSASEPDLPDDSNDAEQRSGRFASRQPPQNRPRIDVPRQKTCPLCQHVYGTKMGGKTGGTRCVNMVKARGQDGSVVCDGDGWPILQQCSYVFMSTKQKMVAKRKVEAALGYSSYALKPRKIHQLQQAFYGEMLNKIRKNQDKIGGELYVSMIAPTSSSEMDCDASQRTVEWSQVENSHRVNAVLLQHMTGTGAKVMFADVEHLDTKLKHACEEMCAVAQSVVLDRQSSGPAVGQTETKPLKKCSLKPLLDKYCLGQYHKKLLDAGFSLDSLETQVAAGQASNGNQLSGQRLAETIGIPIGAACKVVLAVRSNLSMANSEQAI